MGRANIPAVWGCDAEPRHSPEALEMIWKGTARKGTGDYYITALALHATAACAEWSVNGRVNLSVTNRLLTSRLRPGESRSCRKTQSLPDDRIRHVESALLINAHSRGTPLYLKVSFSPPELLIPCLQPAFFEPSHLPSLDRDLHRPHRNSSDPLPTSACFILHPPTWLSTTSKRESPSQRPRCRRNPYTDTLCPAPRISTPPSRTTRRSLSTASPRGAVLARPSRPFWKSEYIYP